MAFSDPAKFSKICGVPEDLIRDFHYLILALTCKWDIDAQKFGDLARSWLTRFFANDDINWNWLSVRAASIFCIDLTCYREKTKCLFGTILHQVLAVQFNERRRRLFHAMIT